MKVLNELGFLSEEPVKVENQLVSPKDLTMAILEPQLKGESNEDVTVLRTIVEGTKNNKKTIFTWEMIDLYV